jgi:hypothetical protein
MVQINFSECKKLVAEFNEIEELTSNDRLLLKNENEHVILDDANDSTEITSVDELRSILEQLHTIYND